MGFGLGGVPVSFGLFLEFIPSANRGRHSIILQSAWTIGALVEAALAWIILPIGRWRALLLVSTMPLGRIMSFKIITVPYYAYERGAFRKLLSIPTQDSITHSKTPGSNHRKLWHNRFCTHNTSWCYDVCQVDI